MDAAINAAPSVAGFIPGRIGYGIGAAATAISSGVNATKEEKELANDLGLPGLRSLSGQSALIRDYIKELDSKPVTDLTHYGVGTAGAVIGGMTSCAAAGAIFGPLGMVVGLAGSFVGGSAAESAYDALCGGEDPLKMAVKRVAAIRAQWKEDAKIDPDDAFLVLASKLPKHEQKMINEAIAAMPQGNKRGLTRIRRNFDYMVRHQVMDLLGDHYDLDKTASRQLAELMSTPDPKTGKKLDPVVMLLDNIQSVTPETGLKRIARKLHDNGVTSDASNHLPLPARNVSGRRMQPNNTGNSVS